MGPVDAVDGVPFRFLDQLLRLTLGPGDGLVVGFLTLVDQSASILDRLVDILECLLDGSGRGHDVLELHGGDLDAELVLFEQFVHLVLALGFDVGPFGADDIEDGPVPDQLVDDRLADVPDGLLLLLNLEQPVVGIDDAVLDDPFHVHDVQVTGEHDRFIGKVLGRPDRCDPRTLRAETELVLEHDLGRDVVVLLDSEGELEVQSRLSHPGVAAEAQHRGGLLRVHDEEAGEHRNQRQDDHDDDRFGRQASGRFSRSYVTFGHKPSLYLMISSLRFRVHAAAGWPVKVQSRIKCDCASDNSSDRLTNVNPFAFKTNVLISLPAVKQGDFRYRAVYEPIELRP